MATSAASQRQRQPTQGDASRLARLRRAFFPDGGEGDDRRVGSVGCVQRVSAPADVLGRAIDLLLDYAADAEAASAAAGRLAGLLSGRDRLTAGRAAALVAALSRKQACRLAFVERPELLAALLGRLHRGDIDGDGEDSDVAETRRLSAAALCHISQSERGCLAIWLCRPLPRLSAAPDSAATAAPAALFSALADPPALGHALACLRRLLASVPESRPSARPGLPLLAGLLGLSDRRLLAAAADCLQMLAFGDPDSKRHLLELGAPHRLAELLRRCHGSRRDPDPDPDQKLPVALARLVRCLTVDPAGKAAVLRSGCFVALAAHAAAPDASHRLVLSCLWPLRNLSDLAASSADVIHQCPADFLARLPRLLLPQLPPLLPGTRPDQDAADAATCAAGLLCNLTCRSRRNKTALVEAGGAAALAEALSGAPPEREEFAEPIVCALRHVTRDHRLAHQAAEEFFRHGGPAALCRLLAGGEARWPRLPGRPLVKAALGLCRNLASLGDYWRAVCVECGLARAAVHALRREEAAVAVETAAAKSLSSAASSDFSPAYRLYDAGFDRFAAEHDDGGGDGGVSLEEVQEVGLACLAALAQSAALAGLARSRRPDMAAGAADLLARMRAASTLSASGAASTASAAGRRSLEQRPASARPSGLEYCGIGHRRDDPIVSECAPALGSGSGSEFYYYCQQPQQRGNFACTTCRASWRTGSAASSAQCGH